MFVSSSDFNLPPYSIPNLDKAVNTFTPYADREEKAALLKLLGKQLYDAFLAGIPQYTYSATVATVIGRQYAYGNDIWEALTVTTGVTPTVGSDWTLIEANNKWLKLKNGANYTYGGKTYQWDGMVKLFTPYIYSVWLRDTWDTHTGVGVVMGNAENAVVISPAQRIARALNDYAGRAGVYRGKNFDADLIYGVQDFRYREFYEYYNCENTLYGFLEANKADYEGWVFTDPGLQNIFNI